MQRMRVYLFDIPFATNTWMPKEHHDVVRVAGRTIGQNIRAAKALLRTIYKVRVLPPGSVVFPEKRVAS